MDTFRLRALWVVDTDTGVIVAERRYPALDRSHRFGSQITGLASNTIVASVLETVSAKAAALERCGAVGGDGEGHTSHMLLGPYSSPQFVEYATVSSKKKTRLPSTPADSQSDESGPTAHVAIGPFVAFSGKRGVRIEVSEALLQQIANGQDEHGEDDDGQTRRALIDDLLTSLEPHPQHAAAENLIVIAAPLVTTNPAMVLSPQPSLLVEMAGEGPFRGLLVRALTSVRAMLSPFLDDVLVIAMEGTTLLTDEIEGATAVVTELLSGWDDVCGRRVVSDLTWRRALETFLSVGISMGRILSVVIEGLSAHGLPRWSSLHSRSTKLHHRRMAAVNAATEDNKQLGSGQTDPSDRKSLQPHAMMKAFDSFTNDDEHADEEPQNKKDEVAVDVAIDYLVRQLEGANSKEIDSAVIDAAAGQVTLYVEQQVAAQCFGSTANSSYLVHTHVMMVPPTKKGPTTTEATLVCLLGGAPSPHLAFWQTAHSRSGPSTAGATADGYLRRDQQLITAIAGAPNPVPMTLPMSAAFTQDKKKLMDEGLSSSGAHQAAGLGRFIGAGTWRLPALSASLPTTSSTGQTAAGSRLSIVSALESYPPLTVLTLAPNFSELAIGRADGASYSEINAVASQTMLGAQQQQLVVANNNVSSRRFNGPAFTLLPSGHPLQRPQSIMTTVHEIPRGLSIGTTSTSVLPKKASAFTGSYAFVPVIDPDRVRKALQNTDFGQGVGSDSTSQEVQSRNKDELGAAREYIEALLSSHGNVLYRVDFEFTLELGGVAAADIPKLEAVFGVTDNAEVLYYHLNVYKEDAASGSTGGLQTSQQRHYISHVTSAQLSPEQFVISLLNGGGTRVANGTTYTVKGIAVCDVSDRPTSGALPSYSTTAGKPSVAPNESDILSAVTIYSSAALHFTLMVDMPFLPGSCVLADPVVMGKCLVDGAAAALDTSGGGVGPGASMRSQPLAVSNTNNFVASVHQDITAEDGDTIDGLQKKIRAVAFSSTGSGSLLGKHLRSPIRIGIPPTPFPADGDSPITWRRSDLSTCSPVTAAAIVRSHPEKGFIFWNYSGDI